MNRQRFTAFGVRESDGFDPRPIAAELANPALAEDLSARNAAARIERGEDPTPAEAYAAAQMVMMQSVEARVEQ